ncbi:adenosylcobinamide amidohydrolase [Streptomyces sp. NPDC053542]|uniref:adenosylcobinamide amidohydrolase n=1 Tax=Streptomyces sp. NPDC053542 TaxID=3365710 RepID=UPI0037D8C105
MTTLIPPLPVRTVRHRDTTDGRTLPALLWRPGPGHRMISSAVLGGGIGARSWVLNAQVAHGYTRRDPQAHLAEIAAAAGATGPGVGMMTAADILRTRSSAYDGGAQALVTAGTGVHGWAADTTPGAAVTTPEAADATPGPAVTTPGAADATPGAADATPGAADATPGAADAAPGAAEAPYRPGTINILVTLPVALSDAALVNSVMTATEAKVQALLDHGLDASGTPTDAVCVAARVPLPVEPVEEFAGPRSLWGARLARAVHEATLRALIQERGGSPGEAAAPLQEGQAPIRRSRPAPSPSSTSAAQTTSSSVIGSVQPPVAWCTAPSANGPTAASR